MSTRKSESSAPAGEHDAETRPPPSGSGATHDEEPGAADSLVEEAAQALEEVGGFSVRLITAPVIGVIAYFGEVVALFGQALRSLLTRGVHGGDLVRQLSVIGAESIPISLLTVGFTGAILALYTADTLRTYGAADLVGGVVALSIVRETGPILVAVSIAARAGSAITAEIASMKVTEQIDALRSMAISPVEYLVVPRLLASLIMLPLVCICADAAGVWGGAIVASGFDVSFSMYVNSIRQMMETDGSDITQGLLKTVVFGVIIALVGCREGLETSGGATGVGQSTTRSVVIAIVLIFIADFILSFLMKSGNLL